MTGVLVYRSRDLSVKKSRIGVASTYICIYIIFLLKIFFHTFRLKREYFSTDIFFQLKINRIGQYFYQY